MKRSLKLLVAVISLSVIIIPMVSCKPEGNNPAEKVFLYGANHVNDTFFLSLEDYQPIEVGYAVKYNYYSNVCDAQALSELVTQSILTGGSAVMGEGYDQKMYYSSIRVFDTINFGAAIAYAYTQGQLTIYRIADKQKVSIAK